MNKKFLLFLFPLFLFLVCPYVNARPVTDVSGSYGFIKCTNDAVNGLSNCAYVQSYGIIGENTSYTMLEKATTFVHNHTNYARLNVFSSLFLFPNLNYKNGSFYTLNFVYSQGGYVSTIIDTITEKNLVVESFNGTDYVSGGYTDLNFSADKNGHISITFKATTDTSSYRIRIQPGVAIWSNPSTKYDQGVRVFLISANVEDNLSDALLNQITNQNQVIINQNQELIDNSKKATEEQKKTNDFIMDDTEPNSDISSLGNVQGLLPPGPVDSLLNIPFKFLSVVVSSLGDLCVPLSGKFVFNSTLTLPCFTPLFYDKVPDSLMIFINLIPSAFILINYLKHLYKKVDRAISMETNSDDEWGVL